MRTILVAAALALAASPALADNVDYRAAGRKLTGYFAASSAETAQGLVLIVHDWDGVDDYERRRADMLADLGYDAFVLDMFGSTVPLETAENRRAATAALYRDRDLMRGLIAAGLTQARALSDADDLVVVGYCFGGAVALEMARSKIANEAEGYATFHGVLATPEGESWSTGTPPLLIMQGGADRVVTMRDVATLVHELEAVDASYTVEIYSGAPHAFTVLGSDRYQKRADHRSWAAFTAFLARHLGG